MACNSHFPTQIGCGQSQCRHLVPVSVSGPKNRRRTTNNIISGNLHIPGALHAGTPQVRRTHGAALDRPIHRIPRKRIINWLLNRPRHSEFTILICPRCQDPQQVIRRHDSNHNTLDRNIISGNIVPNLNLSGRNVRNYFPRMAPVVDQSTSLGPDPIRPHWIRNAPLRNRRVVQLFQNLARNRIGQDDRRTKYRVELFRSIRRSGHPEALIRTYRRNLIQRKVITGKFILIEQSVELRFRGRRETYVTVGRFDLSTRYRGRTAALPAMGSNAVHRTLHDLQRTRIGTRLFHRRNRQLTRRIPRGRKNLLFERRATPQQDCKQQKVRFLHRHNVFADKLQ